jgi:hypothetical protein
MHKLQNLYNKYDHILLSVSTNIESINRLLYIAYCNNVHYLQLGFHPVAVNNLHDTIYNITVYPKSDQSMTIYISKQ